MPIFELRRFGIICDKPDCDGNVTIITKTNDEYPDVKGVEYQIGEQLRQLEWRVRAANTSNPSFLCPKHFQKEDILKDLTKKVEESNEREAKKESETRGAQEGGKGDKV